jgi:hypothetical protein
VMVTGEVAVGIELEEVNVNNDEPEPTTELGLKLAETPLGSPLAVKVTWSAKPAKELTAML